jgi:hypothetical protein
MARAEGHRLSIECLLGMYKALASTPAPQKQKKKKKKKKKKGL